MNIEIKVSKKLIPYKKAIEFLKKRVESIKNSKETEKREFVNKLWSFHVNSNFQIIRWCLLTSGYNDDASKKFSVYKLVIKS